PAGTSPDSNLIAYLNDIGFQAFIFFGVLIGGQAIWLRSNSKDKTADPKALVVDLSYFKSNKVYAVGATLICVLVLILYVVLW
ncbi:MAG: sodium/glucose cotransporter, partial [Bacteroidales bacterium]|nr:sodium/glucose cotransporter [Bacteroidales bacterium]